MGPPRAIVGTDARTATKNPPRSSPQPFRYRPLGPLEAKGVDHETKPGDVRVLASAGTQAGRSRPGGDIKPVHGALRAQAVVHRSAEAGRRCGSGPQCF